MPEARHNNSKLAEMFVSASSFSALVGIAEPAAKICTGR
jgi:phosphotransferase system  glucose/maltose/N-acetylglucosamine-specific IIC component